MGTGRVTSARDADIPLGSSEVPRSSQATEKPWAVNIHNHASPVDQGALPLPRYQKGATIPPFARQLICYLGYPPPWSGFGAEQSSLEALRDRHLPCRGERMWPKGRHPRALQGRRGQAGASIRGTQPPVRQLAAAPAVIFSPVDRATAGNSQDQHA